MKVEKTRKMSEIEKPIFIGCSCRGEFLRVSYDRIIDQFDFSIYSMDFRNSWKYKLKLIWRIIRYGTPYTDQMTIEREELNQLTEYLDDINQSLERGS